MIEWDGPPCVSLEVPKDLPHFPEWGVWRDTIVESSIGDGTTTVFLKQTHPRAITWMESSIYFLRRNVGMVTLHRYTPWTIPCLVSDRRFRFERLERWPTHQGSVSFEDVLVNLPMYVALRIL